LTYSVSVRIVRDEPRGERRSMYLSDVKDGEVVVIKRFLGGRRFIERMNSMGIFEGSRVRVIRQAPFKGPVLIEEMESSVRVMIGYGMAQKIEVGKE
jgi:Fe2+ transport system protein FeoA